MWHCNALLFRIHKSSKMDFCVFSTLTEAVLLCPWLHLYCKTTQRLQEHLNKSDQATNLRVKATEG